MKLSGECLRRSTGLAFLLALYRQVCGEGCPPDPVERAFQCVASFSGTASQTQKNNMLSEWDLSKIRHACNNGTFSRSIACAENIINSCEDVPDQRDHLKRYIDISKQKEAVDHICTQTLTELSGYSDCIREQIPLVKQCGDAEVSEFRYKVSKFNDDPERVLKAACQFMHQVFKCQSRLVRENCGEKPAAEITTVMSYLFPHHCSSEGEESPINIGDIKSVSWLMILVSSILVAANSFRS